MEKPDNNMKMLIHIAGEMVVMGAIGVYFYRRCNHLEERLAQLEQEHMYMLRAINPALFKQKSQPTRHPQQQNEEEIISPEELDEIIDEELGEEGCEEGVCKIKQ